MDAAQGRIIFDCVRVLRVCEWKENEVGYCCKYMELFSIVWPQFKKRF